MLAVLSIILMVVLDQAVKLWAVRVLEPVGSIPLIEGVFHLSYVENRGAAFSILQDQRMFFLISTLVIFAAIIIALRKGIIQTKTGKWALYLVFGGAMGNYLDRLLRGFVVDLFYFKLIDFPVFNVADIFVCAGAALFFIYVLFQHKSGEEGETDA